MGWGKVCIVKIKNQTNSRKDLLLELLELLEPESTGREHNWVWGREQQI